MTDFLPILRLLRTLPVLGMVLAALSAAGRTIVLDAESADRMAVIHAKAPRLSWAAFSPRAGQFDTSRIEITPHSRFLIRFDLSAIPEGQEILHAELTAPVESFSGGDPRLFLWRTVAEWGAGVNYEYRRADPAPEPWALPGASGAGADRALFPSVVERIPRNGDFPLNVTADVALWQAGAAPRQGWMISVEDADTRLTFPSPAWNAAHRWTLRITYEPK